MERLGEMERLEEMEGLGEPERLGEMERLKKFGDGGNGQSGRNGGIICHS